MNNLKLQSKENIDNIIYILTKTYPNAKCGLNFNSPLELMVALILAAQCTDAMVNKIVPKVFLKYKTLDELAKADIVELQQIIRPCGYYINKSKSIISSANILINDFNSTVPNTMDDLCKLSGIGRKSANIILQECFNVTVGIAVDTHVMRLSKRIGFTKNKEQVKIEKDLMKKVNKKYWNTLNHLLVSHGRAICDAKKPKCSECILKEICKKNLIKT